MIRNINAADDTSFGYLVSAHGSAYLWALLNQVVKRIIHRPTPLWAPNSKEYDFCCRSHKAIFTRTRFLSIQNRASAQFVDSPFRLLGKELQAMAVCNLEAPAGF